VISKWFLLCCGSDGSFYFDLPFKHGECLESCLSPGGKRAKIKRRENLRIHLKVVQI
jgi:hypothetical protein